MNYFKIQINNKKCVFQEEEGFIFINPGTPEAGMRYPRQLSDSSNNILPLFIVTQDPNVILKNPQKRLTLTRGYVSINGNILKLKIFVDQKCPKNELFFQ